MGVDLFFGAARFVDAETAEVAGQRLRFRKAVIATGTRPSVPAIEGLVAAGYLTNETIFSLTELPPRLGVIGGGPIGCELAQAFQRLGSEVVLFHNKEHLLDKEEFDAAEIVEKALISDGVQLALNSRIHRVEASHEGKAISFHLGGAGRRIVVDEILVAAGRAPNVSGLGLESAGVAYDDRHGVRVNDFLRTANRRVYAAGDICLKWKFTHAADASARVAIQNALFFGRRKASALTIPWCTYTDPEVARVGLSEKEARERGWPVSTFKRSLDQVDRALLDGETGGFVKIHVRQGTGRIVGATLVARHAGEMINEITLAMMRKAGLGTLANVVHPYPTQAEAIRQIGDAYNRTRLTSLVRGVLSICLKLGR
jgi:pyruvate/2-oxoglutarate dehydrogenase complex dihydrolipoamide dehydrogenase (E3) component